MNKHARIAARLAASLIATPAVLTVFAAPAAHAAAKTQTLRYYSVSQSTHFYNSRGKRINLSPPATLPTNGDRLNEFDRDYVGSFSKHATHATASDHLQCTFTNSDTGKCSFTITIGKSELSSRFVQHFQDPAATYKISHATGVYAGTHGTLTASNTSNGQTDLVIKLS